MGKIIASIECIIRAYYHHTNQATPSQAVFGIDMILNLVSVLDWRVITVEKQHTRR